MQPDAPILFRGAAAFQQKWGAMPPEALRAHDKATGEILHEIELPANQSGVPMTCEVNGRQYIVVVVGARGIPGELVALTLP